jgi:hypothetical protein
MSPPLLLLLLVVVLLLLETLKGLLSTDATHHWLVLCSLMPRHLLHCVVNHHPRS